MKDIAELVARKLLKAASKDELDTISRWEKKTEKNKAFIRNTDKYWNYSVDETPVKRLEQVRSRLITRINSKEEAYQERSVKFYLSRIAAAVILVLAISSTTLYLANQMNSDDSNQWVQISTDAGQRSQISLPDGSKVWLNADTRITYQNTSQLRSIMLDGEAYFEVEHAADHPFVVETGNGKVKVLGTKFNVAHYKGSSITETSLLSGKITMTLPNNKQELILNPGDKLTFDAQKATYIKEQVEVEDDILWREGILVFQNETFDTLIKKLERYYGVDINYPKDKFQEVHYSGTIDKLQISNVIEFLSLTIPMNYEINNTEITIH